MERVFITGLGTISSIGINVKESFDSLTSMRSGIGEINLLDTNLKTTLPAGEIKLNNEELKNILKIKSNKIFSRSALLGLIAAQEALQSSVINCKENKIGFFNATSVGGMDRGEELYKNYINNTQYDKNYALVHDCGESTETIANHLGIKDFLTTISTACSSSANAIMQAAKMIKAGMLDCAVAGGSDGLTLFTINGFNSLMILSDEKCKPFDQERKGLNLGEGAGYIVLESEKNISKSNRKPLAELTGYGNACDAYHQTASSENGQGAYLAMKKALLINNIDPENIDYINAHGTATVNNDLSEGRAIERVFGNKIPPFSSTKAYTGHTLAASGGIEAVYSVLAIQNNIVYPNLNFKNKINDLSLSPETSLKHIPVLKNVLSNSFGFGGNNSSLIFSKC